MWTRSELKEKAKAYVKRSYWPLVLVSLILAVITGGFSNGGNSGRGYSTDWSGGVDGGDIASRITGNITGIDWALVGGIMAIAAVFAVAVIAIAVIVSHIRTESDRSRLQKIFYRSGLWRSDNEKHQCARDGI